MIAAIRTFLRGLVADDPHPSYSTLDNDNGLFDTARTVYVNHPGARS